MTESSGTQLSELIAIYLVEFPVLRKHERGTYYDSQGRIVFTNNSQGLPGVGLGSQDWKKIKDQETGSVERVVLDDTMPGGPVERTIVYEAPFDRCDREKDYEVAWEEFERRLGKSEAVAV